MGRRVDVKVRLDSNVADETKKDSKAVEKLTDDMEHLGDKGTKSFSALEKASTVASVAIAASAAKIGFELVSLGVQTTKQAQKVQTQFETILDSAEAAEQRYAELAKFAASTPFTLQGVAESSKVLETLTDGVLSTGKGLRLVGDAAAISGENFQNLSVQVGRAYSGLQANRPVGEALARLQELGLVSGQTRNEIELLQKQSRGTEAWDILQGALEKSSGGMEKLAQTFEGKTSTIVDNTGLISASFLKTSGIQNAWNDILDATIEKLDKVGKKQAETEALQTAKETSLLSRTYEQQLLILKDLEAQYERYNSLSEFNKKTVQLEIDVLKSSIKNAKELLPLIKNRQEETKATTEAVKEKNKTEKEALRVSKLQIEVDKKNDQLQNKNLEKLKKEVELREKQKNNELDRLRIQEVQAAEGREQAAVDRIEFERKVNEDIQLLTADRYETERILLRRYVDDYALAASEVYDTEEGLNSALLELDKLYTERSKKLDDNLTKSKIQNSLSVASTGVGALREFFGENKAFASADIVINTARGIQRAFADLPVPFSGIQAAFVGATGVAQLAKVNGAKFANGGLIQGAGTGTSDSVPIQASNGEFMVKASEVPDNRELLEAINSGRGPNNQGNTIIVVTDPFATEEELAIKTNKIIKFGVDTGIIDSRAFA